MTLVHAVRRLFPARLNRYLSEIAYPYRHGRRFFKPYVVKKEMEGVAFDFFVGDRTGRDWYDRPCINNPIWREMAFVRDNMAEPGDVIFECGGHHGCSAILLSQWIGERGKVVTFEPFATNFEILEKNLRLNRLANVTARQEAVGAQRGTVTFDRATSGISAGRHGQVVPLCCLDDYIDLKPNFLKIDVEGFELDVLRGAKEIMRQSPKLEIEVHPDLLKQYGGSTDDLFDMIEPARYDMWIQWRDDHMPEPYDPAIPIAQRAHLFCLPKALQSAP